MAEAAGHRGANLLLGLEVALAAHAVHGLRVHGVFERGVGDGIGVRVIGLEIDVLVVVAGLVIARIVGHTRGAAP